jgi:endogenous inhibitor of DNA gyrase (YacG/DUF329 family)
MNNPSRVITNCHICGKEIELIASRVKPGSKNFCSKECLCKYRKESRIEKIKVICLECGKEFEKLPSRMNLLNYCSKECRAKHYQNKKIKAKCPNCGKVFFRKTDYSSIFCCRGCCYQYNIQNRYKGKAKFKPQVYSIADLCRQSPYRANVKVKKLGIMDKVNLILNPDTPPIERRNILYANAKDEILESMADTIWEPLMDHELGIA